MHAPSTPTSKASSDSLPKAPLQEKPVVATTTTQVPGKGEGLFSALKDVLPVLAIYSYFAGWIYAYAFFKAFRIPVSSLDIPFQYFLMYSFSALASWKGFLLIFATATCVVFLQRHRLVMAMIASLLFIILFGVALAQGTSDADLQRHETTNDRILLSFTDDARKTLPDDLQFNNEHDSLYLLAETKDRIIVFHQDPPNAAGRYPSASVYDVSKSDVKAIKREIAERSQISLISIFRSILHEQPSK